MSRLAIMYQKIITIPKLRLSVLGIQLVVESFKDIMCLREVAEVDVLFQSVNSLGPGTIQKLYIKAVCICKY